MADWGIELWDKYETVADYVQRGIEFGERYAQFLKERIAAEQEYANKLKKLVEKYQPKKKEEEEYRLYTGQLVFAQNLSELESIANSREQLAQQLHSQLYTNLAKLHKELRDKKKQHLSDGLSKQRELKQSHDVLEKSKRTYERASRDYERALENYRRVDSDLNQSRAEVEKAKNLQIGRSRQCDQLKSDYAAQLQQYNDSQRNYYTIAMPAIFKSLQECDRLRIEQLQRFLLETATLELQMLPNISKCLESCQEAVQTVNAAKDAETVVSRNKTGFPIPPDIEFEDMSSPVACAGACASGAGISVAANPKIRSPANGRKFTIGKPAGWLFKMFKKDDEDDLSTLPPAQRCKRLKQKLDGLYDDQRKGEQEREKILKLRDVFARDPAQGDPNSLDPKIEENSRTLDELKAEIKKYQDCLKDAQNALTPQTQRKEHSSTSIASTSEATGNDSASSVTSHGASDVSSHKKQQRFAQRKRPPLMPKPDLSRPRKRSFERNDSFEDEPFQGLGSCRALYTFLGGTEGSISMQEGEELIVTEEDQGDGWTRVRQSSTGVEGFVPTTYLQVIQWFETI